MSAATVSKRKGYIGAGVAGLLLAAGYLAMSLDLPFGRIDQPGAGEEEVTCGVDPGVAPPPHEGDRHRDRDGDEGSTPDANPRVRGARHRPQRRSAMASRSSACRP